MGGLDLKLYVESEQHWRARHNILEKQGRSSNSSSSREGRPLHRDLRASIDREESSLSPPFSTKQPCCKTHTFTWLLASDMKAWLALSRSHFPSLLLTSKNMKGDTPLHVAARAGHYNTVATLIRFGVDSPSCTTSASNVVRDKADVYPDILLSSRNNGGNTPLHEAMLNSHGDLIYYLVQMDEKVSFFGNDVVSFCENKEGKSPFYLAVEWGEKEIVERILQLFIQKGYSYEDMKGKSPVHAAIRMRNKASERGHVDIVQKLLQYYPDGGELPTKEWKKTMLTPELTKLLNEKDDHGNTALHLATMHWHPNVVSSLTWDKKIKLGLVNDDGMTALDVAEDMEMMASFRKRLTWMALKSAGAPQGKISKAPKENAQIPLQHEPPNMENYKDRINTLLLVSTLIATVTYAAVVSRVIWLAYVTVVMGMVSLAILLALFIPHSFPTTSKYRVVRLISYYFFCLMMRASGCYHDDKEE
ncbi:ankyrin repeat family protein [Actinidia rufa]|uniref:Ankyrin repeat family protein n=1 Tax=Actinidia rufa TaxID=165716 RepID=A0A7J0G4J9_9ERIC|nr:ankyrin repeat family protein [Actinidia rufa]